MYQTGALCCGLRIAAAQESRNDFLEGELADLMELGPSAVLFLVKADHMGQLLAVQRLLGVFPTVGNLG